MRILGIAVLGVAVLAAGCGKKESKTPIATTAAVTARAKPPLTGKRKDRPSPLTKTRAARPKPTVRPASHP